MWAGWRRPDADRGGTQSGSSLPLPPSSPSSAPPGSRGCLGAGGVARADASLGRGVRASAAIFGGRIGAAEEQAAALARTPALQRALRERDAAVLRDLVHGDIAVYSGGRRVGGPAPGAAVTRSGVGV